MTVVVPYQFRDVREASASAEEDCVAYMAERYDTDLVIRRGSKDDSADAKVVLSFVNENEARVADIVKFNSGECDVTFEDRTETLTFHDCIRLLLVRGVLKKRAAAA